MSTDNDKKSVYDEEDVWFCASCLSLKIVNLGDDELVPCYCDTCGSTDIEASSIEAWQNAYRKRYRKDFINKK